MKLTIKINMDNEAFEDNASEVDRILKKYIIGQLADDYDPAFDKTLLDINGNAVGTAKITK